MTAFDINQLRPSWVRRINVAHVQDLVPGDCWLWTGAHNRGTGYGRVCIPNQKRTGYTHRAVYEMLVAPIPQGLHIDHLCRQPPCCNPAHLEPVSSLMNTRRGKRATQTECKNGHPLSGENLRVDTTNPMYPRRVCRKCRQDYLFEWRLAQKKRKRETWALYLPEKKDAA